MLALGAASEPEEEEPPAERHRAHRPPSILPGGAAVTSDSPEALAPGGGEDDAGCSPGSTAHCGGVAGSRVEAFEGDSEKVLRFVRVPARA
ncbi:MAG: hypothetical protein AMXMBFR34_37850 [Myxococcaceae bacterium]